MTSKDNLSSFMSLADGLHRYHIRVRDVDAMPLPEPQITGWGEIQKGEYCLG